jgi:hypothetical protein
MKALRNIGQRIPLLVMAFVFSYAASIGSSR